MVTSQSLIAGLQDLLDQAQNLFYKVCILIAGNTSKTARAVAKQVTKLEIPIGQSARVSVGQLSPLAVALWVVVLAVLAITLFGVTKAIFRSRRGVYNHQLSTRSLKSSSRSLRLALSRSSPFAETFRRETALTRLGSHFSVRHRRPEYSYF